MDKEKDCEIVQDLLPSYIDGITSEISSEFVRKHIKECKKCSQIYDNMNRKVDVQDNLIDYEVNFLKKHNSKYKIIKKIVIALIVFCVLFIISIAILVWIFFTGGFPDKTSDVSKYGEWEGLLAYSNLLIFPDEIPESAENIDYYYYNRDELNIASCQVFLNCTYSEEDFSNEVDRLANINRIKYEENKYPYPAYVATQNSSLYEYEYALVIQSEKKIVYILNKSCMKKTFKIPEVYLSDTMYTEEDRPFTIYINASLKDYIYWPASHMY